jgi:non-specific serine/threonine protein kinase
MKQKYPLCVHKVALFLQLFKQHGPYYFDTIRNWDKEKNKLLQIYGYNLDDDLAGKFEFIYKEGKPFLKVLDTSIKRVTQAAPVARPSYFQENRQQPEPEVATTETYTKKLGLVFNFNATTYPHFALDVIQGDADEITKSC